MDVSGFACAETNKSIIVTVENDEFMRLVKQANDPMIIHQIPGWFSGQNRYLLTYRGVTFYTRSKEELSISKNAEVITAKYFYVPHTM